MEFNTINKEIEKLPKDQREAVLSLIDLKTNNDMKEVIHSIDGLKDSLKNVENKLESKITTVFWILGILISLVIALLIRLWIIK